LLDHVLNTENFPSSSITLIGNSAGSNLLLGLLLHLSHPNPDLPPLNLKNDEQLAAAAVISPWCTMDVSAAAMKINADKDILAPSSIAYWGRNFLGGRAPDPWNTPLIAPAGWWGDVKVNEMLLLYGEDEILRDDTAMLCETIKVSAAFFIKNIIYEVLTACRQPIQHASPSTD
jgi:acetyl esterase/lipase